MLTREERVAAVLVTITCVLGLASGYRLGRWPILWFLGAIIVVMMLVLIAAGVPFSRLARTWRPRMLLVLVGVVPLPLSLAIGAKLWDLDFRCRQKKQYEALIATIEPPPALPAGEAFPVSPPASLNLGDLPIRALRQRNGQLRVDLLRSRHLTYVYCAGGECEPDPTTLHSMERLDQHWFIAGR